MTQQTIDIKRGATLSLAGTALLAAGHTWNAESELKNAAGVKVADLVVTLTPLGSPTATATHSITIIGSSVITAALAVQKHKCDVRFFDTASPPNVVDSPTFVVNVLQEVTHVG